MEIRPHRVIKEKEPEKLKLEMFMSEVIQLYLYNQ